MALTLVLLFSVPLPFPASAVSPSLLVQLQLHQGQATLLEYVSVEVRRMRGLSDSIKVRTDVHEQHRHACLYPVLCLPILSAAVSAGSIGEHERQDPPLARASSHLQYRNRSLCSSLGASHSLLGS